MDNDFEFDAKTEKAIDNATRVCVLKLMSTLKHSPEWINEIASSVISRNYDTPQKEEDRLSEEIIDEIDNRIYAMLLDIKFSVPALDQPYRDDLKKYMDKKFEEDIRIYRATGIATEFQSFIPE